MSARPPQQRSPQPVAAHERSSLASPAAPKREGATFAPPPRGAGQSLEAAAAAIAAAHRDSVDRAQRSPLPKIPAFSGPIRPSSSAPAAPLQRVQRLPVRLPSTHRVREPPNPNFPDLHLTTEYDFGDVLEIDTNDVLGVHIPGIEEEERQHFILRFSAAYEEYGRQHAVFQQEEIRRVLDHLRHFGYGREESQLRTEIVDTFRALVAAPIGVATPSLQAALRAHFHPQVQAVNDRERRTRQQLVDLRAEVNAARLEQQTYAAGTAAAKGQLFTALRGRGVPLQQVPAANREVPGPGATLGAYTVGASTTALVSIHGAAGGQDVMGWPSVSDLNYKYGLVHVHVKKLCAAHLLPALLGGQTTNQNLTPIPNEANGWLSANPERAAKQIVFSEGGCVRYTVACTFGRGVAPPIEGDVAALVPDTFEVRLTKLRWNGTDPSTNWDNYVDDGVAQVFTVPANLLTLNDAAMSDGVRRADLNRANLQNGMR